ncbi:MAG TPA: hypothetical protein VHS97_04775, partial [Isosphaeraceae bacterium]|nr:hypothetical protein [Isosphaeraceae bacterium]
KAKAICGKTNRGSYRDEDACRRFSRYENLRHEKPSRGLLSPVPAREAGRSARCRSIVAFGSRDGKVC